MAELPFAQCRTRRTTRQKLPKCCTRFAHDCSEEIAPRPSYPYLAMLVSQHSDILMVLKTNGVESYDLTVARRISPLLLFDMVCWSCLCLVMVLTSAGASMSTLVQVGTAMGCLPLKAALNPVMYLAGCLQERQCRVQRQRLLQQLGVAKQL